MPEAGYSAAACLDFDFAVRGLKRWADNREQMTRAVPISEAEQKAKPKKQVPVYRTLAEVLALDADDAKAALRLSGIGQDEIDDLADEFMRGGYDDEEDDA